MHTGEQIMLVLSRKVGQRILVGDKISITVVRVNGGGVRLGIEAPAELPVIREEMKEHLDSPPPNVPMPPAAKLT